MIWLLLVGALALLHPQDAREVESGMRICTRNWTNQRIWLLAQDSAGRQMAFGGVVLQPSERTCGTWELGKRGRFLYVTPTDTLPGRWFTP